MTDLALRRRRAALFVFFLIPGLSMSSWVTRTPDVRDRLGASTGEMGLVLFGLSVGSMLGILSSGALVSRFGARPVIGAGTSLIVLSMLVIGTGAFVPSAPLVAAGLFLFGAGMGGGEVAVNVDGADVERITGRTVLPTLHGFFSLGTVVGAGVGILCTAVGFPVQWHLIAMAVVTAAMFAHAYRSVPAGIGKAGGAAVPPDSAVSGSAAAADSGASGSAADAGGGGVPGAAATGGGAGAVGGEGAGPAAPAAPGGGHAVRPGRPWRDRRLLLIGGIILAMALAEGAANDWLPLLMVDGHDLDPALGSAVYAGFAAAMAIGRFSGGFVIDRVGRAVTIRVSAMSAALGLALVIFVDSPLLAAAAVFFWGLGASLGFPVALSAAGDSGPDSAARVSLVATIGYVAFLVGPPGLGSLGDHYGLRSAMIVVLAFAVAAIFLAPAAGSRRARIASSAPAQKPQPDPAAERP